MEGASHRVIHILKGLVRSSCENEVGERFPQVPGRHCFHLHLPARLCLSRGSLSRLLDHLFHHGAWHLFFLCRKAHQGVPENGLLSVDDTIIEGSAMRMGILPLALYYPRVLLQTVDEVIVVQNCSMFIHVAFCFFINKTYFISLF